ncbi:zinc-dependent alcohol dehydrogenase family protein [Candidatus Methylomicrobium oryzae]|jgi:propanol-preferring alcohol dehydrogenase|uniref:zinc-dependent alcohol dehydrogenase family protein n=1 Tax=Candidatus Methylomicrobium oryzae TaxID=2802053 RepID=UPI0019248FAF|nr:zinc-dependent alcohol dehydrogenase family protein [Methylomicrobium sp. RS1]MBL1264093.1 zinc-dependent alcohol dehydrogenase family protein [Methylomicrobium sp. RS1]
MKAMVLTRIGKLADHPFPLALMELPVPVPGTKDVLIKVSVCGVCHTELDEIEGRTPPPMLPVILGHQTVGHIVAAGEQVSGAFKPGDRVGVAWIFSACGECKFCRAGNENLCPDFLATGRDANGGYAEYMTAPAHFVYPIPPEFSDAEAAPLLCAGAIGYRSLRLTGIQDGDRLGLTGFGASGHLVLKMARYRFPQSEIYVFARSAEERRFAIELGAAWAGESAQTAPHKLDAIIDTTPVWAPIVSALANLEAGGRLVINAIRKEDDRHHLLALDYPEHLWREKEIKSVANITRRDVAEFLQLAADMRLKPEIRIYPLEQANQALSELKTGRIRGAKVLRIG